MSKLELVQAWHTESPIEQTARMGHQDSGIFRMQLTPDDRYAVTLNYQYRELIVWDFATGQRVKRYDWRGYDKVHDLYLTPDGKYAVVLGETGGVVSIDPAQPNPGLVYKFMDDQGQTHQLLCWEYAIVSARSQRAISGNGRAARTWDFEKEYFTAELEIPTIHRDNDTWNPLHLKAISNDGKYGSGMFDFHLLIWDLENGKVLWHRDFSKQPPYQIIFTPDGEQVVLKFMSRLETWRWSTNQMDGPAFDAPAATSFHNLVFTPDWQTLITGADNGTIHIWDWPSGRLKQTLVGHRYSISCLAVSSDGEYLASASSDTTLRKWHLASGKQVFSTLRAGTKTKPLAIDPDGRYLISPYGCDGATLAIYDLASGTLQRTLQGHQGDINTIAFLSEGRLISASDDHTLRIWNLESGTCLQTLSGEHTDRVQAVVSIPDRNQVISAASDGRIITWDLSTSRPVRPLLSFAPPTSPTEQYMFIDRRGHFAVVNKANSEDKRNGTPILLDLESGRESELRTRLPGFRNGGGMLSPGGQWLVQTMPNQLMITNLASQQAIRYSINGRLGDLWCFSSDEQTLITTHELTKIVLIDLKSGAYRFPNIKPAKTEQGNHITALALSPDGRQGAIGVDNSIRVWELSSGEELAALDFGQNIYTLAFDPYNRYLLVGGNNTPLCCFELRGLID